jgi:hypothetical protein
MSKIMIRELTELKQEVWACYKELDRRGMPEADSMLKGYVRVTKGLRRMMKNHKLKENLYNDTQLLVDLRLEELVK